MPSSLIKIESVNPIKTYLTLEKTQRQLEVRPEQTLMQNLLDQSLPVASSCNGDGICGKCRIQVLSGMENLSAETELEKILREKYHLDKNERISCQTYVLGDIRIDTRYW